MAERNSNPEVTPASVQGSLVAGAPAVAEEGAARFGVHGLHAWFALGFGLVGAFFGYIVAPSEAEVPYAIAVGVIAGAIVLWAPTVTWLRTGLALLAVALLVVRTWPEVGLYALPVALAIPTSPGRGVVLWLAHVVGVGVVTALAMMVLARSPEAGMAGILVGVVAVVALMVSYRIAGAELRSR